MIFISAGHNSQSHSIKQDPGAVNKEGIKEGDLTIEFRDLVCHELDLLGVKYKKDSDEESLAMYLNRIDTGSGSVVCEYHFDAAESETATGCTSLIQENADRLDKAYATKLANTTASILGIHNRGVISESQSHRGRLGLMREEGLVCLVEIGFITNPDDLQRYHLKKKELAKAHALLHQEAELLIS